MKSRVSLISFVFCLYFGISCINNNFENYHLLKKIQVLIIDNKILEEENFLLKNELEILK